MEPSKKRAGGRRSLGIAAATLLILAVIVACAVMLAKSEHEERIKLRYDGRTYITWTNNRAHVDSPITVPVFGGGFGGGSKDLMSDMATNEIMPDVKSEDDVAASPPVPDAPTDASSGETGPDGAIAVPDHGRKLVYFYEYAIESEQYDNFVHAMESALANMGGYVESSSTDSRDFEPVGKDDIVRSVRKGQYVLRVPADEAGALQELLNGDLSVVIREDVSMEDRTKAYADARAQLESYQIEYDTLQDLLSQAVSVSDLIEIQDRLSWLNYQIEYARKSMELIDEDVAYSRVDLTIYEVEYYTASVSRYVFDVGSDMADAAREFVRGLPVFLFTIVYFVMAGFVAIGLCSVLFHVLFAIRNRKARDQVVRLVDYRKPDPVKKTDSGGEKDPHDI